MQSNVELVVTLVAAAQGDLAPTRLKDIILDLEKLGGKAIHPNWLAEGCAVDIFCSGLVLEDLRAWLLAQEKVSALDILVQPKATRGKKLLLADMESTIIEQEMLDELADFIGKREEVAHITRCAMNGEIDFSDALRARVGLLKDQPATILDEVAKRVTFMPGALELLAALKAHGVTCWLVSGGFTCFAEPVAAALGFDKVYANNLIVKDGRITGEVQEPLLDKIAKQVLLDKACAEHGLSLNETMTVGDGANDIPMLAACQGGGGLGVAYHAKPHVRAVIVNQINHSNLKTLMYAQGYSVAAI